MKDPLSPSSNHLLRLINSLYDSNDQSRIFAQLLDDLAVFVPFDAAALFIIDRRRYEISTGACSGVDAKLIEAYLQRHASRDPCSLAACCPTRLNETISLSQARALSGSPAAGTHAVQGSFNFEHAITVIAGWRDQPAALLRLHRRPGATDFSADAVELLNGIAPHIAMSVMLGASADMEPIGAETGLVALADDGRVVYTNAAAQDLLTQLEPETIGSLAQSNSIWRNGDAGVHRLRVLPLTSRSLLSWLEHETSTTPEDRRGARAGRVTVILSEPIQRRRALANRLAHSRLSRREVEVALCVMRGMSNADIATELCIRSRITCAGSMERSRCAAGRR